MRYDLTPVGVANINKVTNKHWQAYGERGTALNYLWGCRLAQQLWKAFRSYLRKLKMELPYDIVIPLLGNYQNTNLKEWYAPLCTATYLYILPCLSSVSYNFLSRGVLHPWLNLFLGILLFLMQL